MKTTWIYRVHTIIPVADKVVLNVLWTLIAPEGDSEAQTYGVPLSAIGEEPATHLGMSTAATAIMRGMIEVMQPELATVAYYICDAFSDELLAQQNGNGVIGQPFTWDNALKDQGLQTIQKELP